MATPSYPALPPGLLAQAASEEVVMLPRGYVLWPDPIEGPLGLVLGEDEGSGAHYTMFIASTCLEPAVRTDFRGIGVDLSMVDPALFSAAVATGWPGGWPAGAPLWGFMDLMADALLEGTDWLTVRDWTWRAAVDSRARLN